MCTTVHTCNERTLSSWEHNTAIMITQLARKLPCCSYDQLWNPAKIMMSLRGLCHSKLGETLIGSWACVSQFKQNWAYKTYLVELWAHDKHTKVSDQHSGYELKCLG